MFETPILFIIFNRPHTTLRVFEAIRAQKPRFLYVAADGPRNEKPDDIDKCAATRSIIDKIDWDCELHKLYRNENLGCGHGPAEAITWFFDQVEEGIVLEDDCLPHPDFFRFCSELLTRFRNDSNVGMISGTNPFIKIFEKKPFIVSRYGNSWGWASWRRAWKHFDHEIVKTENPDNCENFMQIIKNKNIKNFLIKEFSIYLKPERKKDVWDYHWLYARLNKKLFSIVPVVNLISNIGFGEEANHTTNPNDKISNLKTNDYHFPIDYRKIELDHKYDWLLFEKFMNPSKKSLSKKIIYKLLKMFFRIN